MARLMKRIREPAEVNCAEEDQSISVKNQDKRVVDKGKKGEHHDGCSKERKRKSGENESGCGSGKRSRKTQEVEVDENTKKPQDVNEVERKIMEAAVENNDEDVEIQDIRSGDKSGIKKRGVNKTDLVLGKRYTKEEDEIIRKAVIDYVEKHKLGEEGIDMVMNCRQHPKLRGCWKEITADILLHRHQGSIYQRAQVIYSLRGRWTKEEINYVKEMHRKHGPDWKLMAKKLRRHRIHVYQMYQFTRLPNLKKGQWSQDEYQALFDLVHADLESKVLMEEKKLSMHGMLRDNISWKAISENLGTRYQLRCCSKWYQCLSSPMVLDGTWADTDDYRILFALLKLDASCEEEVEWDSLIEHRTGDLCRKRWKQMVRGIGEHGSKSFVEQVEVLSRRYRPNMVQVREKLDSRPVVD